MRFRRTLLCNKRERKPSLNIGEPTNVRVIDFSDSLPSLTDAQRKQIREKASSGALRLQSIRSHPPTSPPPPNGSDTRHLSAATNPVNGTSVSTYLVECTSTETDIASPPYSPSDISSEEPSTPLLNTTSKALPSTILTSPRDARKEHGSHAMRMKGMTNDEQRHSSESTNGEEDISCSSFSYETGLKDKKLGADSLPTSCFDEGDRMQGSAHSVKGAKEERSTDAEKAAVRRATKGEEYGT